MWHALVCAAVLGLAAPDAAVVHVGKIQVESNDVFSPDEAAKGWFYRAANAVHIQTRVSFLRKQLLFKEGDVLDIERLAETERNLRALPFIKSASVTVSAARDGVADVLVVTQDAWTTELGGSFGSKGGTTTYSVEFTETDLIGTGRQISLAYDKGTERTQKLISFQDLYLFRPFWRGRVLFADNSDGRQRQIEIARPFYSFATPWAADALASRTAEEVKLYQFAKTISTFSHQDNQVLGAYGRAFQSGAFLAERGTVGLDFTEDHFLPLEGKPSPILPADRNFRYIFATYEHVENSFETLNYVNRDSRYEDFNLAPRIFAKVGVSTTALGAPHNSLFAEAEWSGGIRFSDDAFAQTDVDVQSRFDGGPQNTIVSAFLGYARRFRLVSMPQTFVARAQYDQAWRLDQDVQFEASGLTGLRGYELHSMEGDKRLLFNFEQRFFSEREYLQLFSPGAVVFVDVGTALPEGVPFAVSRMKADAGVGLRIAIARAGGNNILRVDVAYPFQKDPSGRRGVLVSFSSSQAFPFHRTGPSGQ